MVVKKETYWLYGTPKIYFGRGNVFMSGEVGVPARPAYSITPEKLSCPRRFFNHKEHKAHKEKTLCSLWPLWCSFGCGQRRATLYPVEIARQPT